VAVPDETIWRIEPHTAAKHQILRKYLDAWYPILSTYNAKIVYVDGFAGPGRYTGGEPGSPVIALDSALKHRAGLSRGLTFWFIEKSSARADHLESEIGKLTLPKNFKVNVERGTFAESFGQALQEIDNDGSPAFALIDPFGFSGIPYSLIQRLLSKSKCEALITFMVDSINRWLTHPDDMLRGHIIETFGTEEALNVAHRSANRAASLKDLYQRQLKKVAKFVRHFEMRDKDARLVYYLFFASNSSLGHLKMKEAMWKVDPMGDFSFSDSTNPNQQVLFTAPTAAGLAADLAAHFTRLPEMNVKIVEQYVQDDTPYLRKHMGDALRLLQANGDLSVADQKVDGSAHKAGTFPNGTLVRFS